MDSHSRSASPRDSSRPQHRPPSPPTPTAFDNRGFSHDEADPNHNDSFTSNPPQQNGHSKEPNGDTKTLEAVNLELINLTPKNGSKKKEVEVDMNATNPYDEYFVPVNEHRKYMRGEKLYVTADKRGEKGGCKRPLCWTLLGLVVAAIVALIVLAATGVLFTNTPTTVEQYNTSISSARALGGIGSFPEDKNDLSQPEHSHDHSHDDHADHEHNATETTPQTQSDEGLMGSDEMTDASMYVPRTVEGNLRIDNEEFTPEMENPDSYEYQQFAATFSEALKKAIFDRNTIENGDYGIIVEVIEIKKGSLIVTYRVHWTSKSNAESNEDLLTAKSLQTKLNDYLSRNDRMISTYHVAEDKMSSRPVLDLCKFSNNECQYSCEFDDSSLDFTCTCPPGKILDIANPKKCTTLFPNPEQTDSHFVEDTEQKVLDMDANPTTTQPVSEEEKPNQFDTVINLSNQKTEDSSKEDESIERHNGHAPEPVAEPEPEPTAESSTEPADLIGFQPHAGASKPIAEPTAEPAAEPTAGPAAEPTAEPSAEPTAEPSAEPTAKQAAEPAAEPSAEASDEPAAEPSAEPSTEPSAEAVPTAEPSAEPTAEPSAEPSAELTPVPAAEPTPEPSAEPTTELAAEPEPSPSAEPQPITPRPLNEPATDASIEPEESTQSNLEWLIHSAMNPEDTPEQEPTSEPEQTTPESVPKPNQAVNENNMNLMYGLKDHKMDPVKESDESQETERTFIEVKPNSYQNKFISRYNAGESSIETITTPEPASTSNTKDETEVTTEGDWLVNTKNIANIYNSDEISQSRSFPSNDNEILAETTTIARNNNDDISFNILINQNETSSNEKNTIINNDSTEASATTAAPTVNESYEQAVITTSDDKGRTEDETDKMPKVDTANLNESILAKTTVTETEMSTEFSLDKLNNSDEDKNIMNALHAKTENFTASEFVTTENSSGVDITFEDIKEAASYNRSSKAITNENTTVQILPEINTTTESEWLVENITEIPYDENMNNVKKTLTTESSISKGELSNSGDFEPDYFSNIGTTNSKLGDTDVPIYGAGQDYDGDLRVKRVDEDQVTSTTPIMLEELVTKPNLKETTTQAISTDFTPVISVETTTLKDYIYKNGRQDANMPLLDLQPAPVWEQSESGTDLSVKKLPTTIPDETTITPKSKTEVNKNLKIDNSKETFSSHNFTQMNNLNVNVYEVSSHNENNTFSTTGTNSHSAEHEDHESENPFLPEVENNKHLVKKLQEGHDLEPNNLNETQNENIEDHNINMSDAQVSSSNEAVTTVAEQTESATKAVEHKIVTNNPIDESRRDTMITTNDTETTLSEESKTNDASKMDIPEQSTSVVSDFLLDTDDLDTNQDYTTTTAAEGIINESNSISDEFSVIPVAKKNSEKDSFKTFESGNNQNINDITSDSIKNSDRTQKVMFKKFNSIINTA